MWRWLRWRPLYIVIGLFHILWWCALGAQIPDGMFMTRWSMLKSAMRGWKGIAQYKMGYYYTTDEMLQYFRGETDEIGLS